jgi:hypothetical protein
LVRAAIARRAAAQITKPNGHGEVFRLGSKRGSAPLPDFVHAEGVFVPLTLTEKGERVNRQNEFLDEKHDAEALILVGDAVEEGRRRSLCLGLRAAARGEDGASAKILTDYHFYHLFGTPDNRASQYRDYGCVRRLRRQAGAGAKRAPGDGREVV